MTALRAIARNAIGLAGFALLTVGAIALTVLLTSERIAANQERVRQAALLEIVLPEDASASARAAVDLSRQFELEVAALGHREPRTLVLAHRPDAEPVLLLPLRIPDGYSGDIELMLGIDGSGRISGVRVVAHRETPGLGDRIERRRSDWIESFRGRSLGDPDLEGWTVRRDGGDFDAFTGATITPRAIARGIGRALLWFEQSGQALFEEEP